MGGNMKKQDLLEIIKSVGFKNFDDFKMYMLSNTKLNEFGAICYSETRDNLQFNYSNNCNHKFGIGGNINGSYIEYRFNIIFISGKTQIQNENLWKY